MSNIEKLLDEYIADGVMTREEHEAFMAEVHRDGKIDAEESAQISRIFRLVQEGKLKVMNEGAERYAKAKMPEKNKAEKSQTKKQVNPFEKKTEPAKKAKDKAEVKTASAATPFEKPSKSKIKKPVVREKEILEITESYSIEDFVQTTSSISTGKQVLELENEQILSLNVDRPIRFKAGSLISHIGNIRFSQTNSSFPLLDGAGRAFIANKGRNPSLMTLQHEALILNAAELLAFEDSVSCERFATKSMEILSEAGLHYLRLTGPGMIAFSTNCTPLTLNVQGSKAVVTSPSATLAWSGNLVPELKTSENNDSAQMHFTGSGFVVVQSKNI